MDSEQENSANLSVLMNQLACARNEIKNLRQQITSLKHVHRKDVEEIHETLRTWDNNSGPSLPPTSPSVASTSTESDMPARFIGYVETGFSSKRGVPRQPGLLAQSQGIVRLDRSVLSNPQHALEGLDNYSHMWILFFFHANESTHIRAKVAPPRLNGERTGVFATRSPHRPCPIGLSLVKIDSVQDECVFFSGVDMVDGTPVLDLKPYIPQYDTPFPSQVSRFPPALPPSHPGPVCWQRLPRESDGRLEDGDSVLQDTSDTDFDFQDRLLVGEASHSSTDQIDGGLPGNQDTPVFSMDRILDGRDSDEVFLSSSHGLPPNNSVINAEYFDRSPMRSASQREAPEGSEGGSPPSPLPPDNVIRVADWIIDAPVSRLNVQFSDDCTRKLVTLAASNINHVESCIVSILSEDPRSVYIRERYREDPYTCVIEGLNVTCFFDDTLHACLVTDVERVENTSQTANTLGNPDQS